ncbi:MULTISPECIES: GNAT family N-acetyltransferase [unclassified Streptomyces]|uniref:GNAT family N-acetyltransferase n=1 Tax=unclassified Streptomyces TaxID=2593676 RepID=UPI00382FADDD
MLHHVELWVPDLGPAKQSWGWLLESLGYRPYQDWRAGRSWLGGETYVVVEQSPAQTSASHERTRPGLNHLAFHVTDRAALDALVEAAPEHGWTLLFPDRHPFAGGPAHCAGYLENAAGFEVELVVRPPSPGQAPDPRPAAEGEAPLRFQELTGYGLRLRAWRDDDADVDAVIRGLNDPEALRWGPPVALVDPAGAREFVSRCADRWAGGRFAPYCVADADTDAPLGSVALHNIFLPMGHAGVGYWLLPEARGRGATTNAVNLLTGWAFATLGLHRIELGHAIGNDSSCRVAERCGFAYEGIARGYLPGTPAGTFHDMHQHARLSTDPAPGGPGG